MLAGRKISTAGGKIFAALAMDQCFKLHEMRFHTITCQMTKLVPRLTSKPIPFDRSLAAHPLLSLGRHTSAGRCAGWTERQGQRSKRKRPASWCPLPSTKYIKMRSPVHRFPLVRSQDAPELPKPEMHITDMSKAEATKPELRGFQIYTPALRATLGDFRFSLHYARLVSSLAGGLCHRGGEEGPRSRRFYGTCHGVPGPKPRTLSELALTHEGVISLFKNERRSFCEALPLSRDSF